ncbi:hypothetical protein E2C01_079919 [Portunus trituberculatus]|uniref:Uncharacterized protein n=1 Tax=Portunus trituberculatus TaxID=210409 RepID=A0A5B7IUL8_PORTR|nr:hypothetical protein [Portunus trituberculatus]
MKENCSHKSLTQRSREAAALPIYSSQRTLTAESEGSALDSHEKQLEKVLFSPRFSPYPLSPLHSVSSCFLGIS